MYHHGAALSNFLTIITTPQSFQQCTPLSHNEDQTEAQGTVHLCDSLRSQQSANVTMHFLALHPLIPKHSSDFIKVEAMPKHA